MFGMHSRRHFIKHMAGASAVAATGVGFMNQLRAVESAAKKNGKSLIILWMSGGPATIDLWDMKPGTPNGGEHKPKPTSASGVQISEFLPTVAKQMKHAAIIRSLTTTEGDHARGTTLMHTGRSPNPLIEFPHIGSVASVKNGNKEAALPSFITVGGTRSGPGFLGMTYAPFNVQNPGQLPENIAPPQGVDPNRMARRESIFSALEKGFSQRPGSAPLAVDPSKNHSEIYNKAFKLVGAGGKDVFQFNSDDNKILEEYGAQGGFGRGCLLARKLVEAGSVCVEVDLGGWDMHNGIFPTLANQRLPVLDKAMGTLIKDLADRGKLKDTVVLWMGEFGRTPRINQNAGRDHWARCWSVVVAGGNIKGGQAYGSTDADGTGVKDNPVKIADLFATVYQAMGIDPTPEANASIRDNLGRPFSIADTGKPIKELVG
jgi:hypothetical protein